MFKKMLQPILGILTFPVCIGISISLYEQLSLIQPIAYYNQKYFVIGIVAYLVVHAIFFKPSYLYILSHELMHVIAAWLSFGKVKSFKVSPKGGSVVTTKSNLFIALAPYFFPFYTITIALLFFTAKFFIKDDISYNPFIFAIGFTLAFHIILTVDFLKIKQTDLLHTGYIFSVLLIYIVNIAIIGLIFSLLFGNVVFIDFLKEAYSKSKGIYTGIFRQLFL